MHTTRAAAAMPMNVERTAIVERMELTLMVRVLPVRLAVAWNGRKVVPCRHADGQVVHPLQLDMAGCE